MFLPSTLFVLYWSIHKQSSPCLLGWVLWSPIMDKQFKALLSLSPPTFWCHCTVWQISFDISWVFLSRVFCFQHFISNLFTVLKKTTPPGFQSSQYFFHSVSFMESTGCLSLFIFHGEFLASVDIKNVFCERTYFSSTSMCPTVGCGTPTLTVCGLALKSLCSAPQLFYQCQYLQFCTVLASPLWSNWDLLFWDKSCRFHQTVYIVWLYITTLPVDPDLSVIDTGADAFLEISKSNI